MQRSSAAGDVGRDETLDAVAERHGFSVDAAASMLDALVAGNGGMAQFDHPEFGGRGQWMRGGMTMVSQAFDTHLKARVDGLCNDLVPLLDRQIVGSSAVPPSNEKPALNESYPKQSAQWWPAQLGRPDSSGSQSGMRYACFTSSRRLALDSRGQITVYDTLDHHITGISQQQAQSGSVTFSSRRGSVDVATLPVISRNAEQPSVERSMPVQAATSDVITTISQLADLHTKGVLTEAEFAQKKTELLARL